jgi:Lipase (class 3)
MHIQLTLLCSWDTRLEQVCRSNLANAAIHALIATQEGGHLSAFDRSKITFIGVASPRIGNKVFTTMFSASGFKNVWRLSNTGDVVPVLPPIFAGYDHFPTEILIDTTNGQNPIPVLCDNAGNSTAHFDPCLDRQSWVALLTQPNALMNFGVQHTNYLGISIGKEGACKYIV